MRHPRAHKAGRGLLLGLVLLLPLTAAAGVLAPPEVHRVAKWVSDNKDNQRRPYLIIDKVNARVFVFDAAGVPLGADAALLGMARGDKAAAGASVRKLSELAPGDRVTPAGRFLANLDRDANGAEILLIDYEHAIALHPVVKGTAAERRAERLASETTDDNRISFGCINVPAGFFRDVVRATFAGTDGYVYILPESASSAPLFGAPSPTKSPAGM